MSQSYSDLLGKLEKIDDLRTIWKNETTDFTKWLSQEENLNLLGEAVGLDLERIGTEERVGDFRADIFVKELESGKTVIIENQLEDTNHKHLGQIITYAAGKEAGCVIWIVKHAREEHAKAVEWLNSHLDQSVDLFLIEIELWRIGDSRNAPKFNIIEKPNQWAKSRKKSNWNRLQDFSAKTFGRFSVTFSHPAMNIVGSSLGGVRHPASALTFVSEAVRATSAFPSPPRRKSFGYVPT